MPACWKCLSLYVAIATCMGSYLTTASPCNGSPEVLTVDYTARRIFSPGYPFHYDNNLHCEWLFETIREPRTGFGIQLTTLELELDAPYTVKAGKCNDSLEVFEGTPSSLGLSLGKWCGKMKHIIKTLSENVTLRFLTNEYFVGKGFVIEYSLVRVASAECRQGRVTPVHIGRTPLYESFNVINAEEKWLSFTHSERCTWTMEAIDELGHSDPNSALVIEAFSVPYVLCQVGHFTVFDGQDTRSRIVLEWCDDGQPFTKIYLSSNYATLTFFFKEEKKQKLNVEPIHLKLYTRNPTYACNDTHLPSINVGKDPVYFSLPLFKSLSGSICSVHVSQHVKSTLRLEVMSISGQEITCDTEAVIVRASKNEVKKFCNRQQYPMYLPQTHEVIVSTNKSNRVYIKALTNDHYCGEDQGLAYDDLIVEQRLPKDLDLKAVPHNCYLRYVISTNKKNRTISLNLTWSINVHQNNVFSGLDACDGDFISVYDGVNESFPLLFSSCRKSDMPNNYVRTWIVGTEEKLLILYNTDGTNEVNRAIVQYYAVPANIKDCRNEHEISVNRAIQHITSPNYPDFYPLNHICRYILTAAEGNIIVVEPEDTKFTSGCGDVLNIYEGTSWNSEDIFGRICGHDKTNKRFVSTTHRTGLQFSSDKFGSTGGWKLKVYSRGRMSGGNKPYVNLMMAALLFFSVVVRL